MPHLSCWTDEPLLRHTVFFGLREENPACKTIDLLVRHLLLHIRTAIPQ